MPRLVGFMLFRIAVIAALGASARAEVLKIATLAPDGSTWMEAVRRGAAEVARRTEGRVTFRFYPGGAMGNDQAVLRKIRIGQLHGGALTAGGLAAVYRDAQIYSMPMLFRSYAEVDAARRQVDGALIAGLADNGFVSFGFVEGGFAYLLSTKPTRTFGDLTGRKPWVPEGDSVGRAIFAAAGVTPVPLPLSDVLTGLQTGLIDSVAGTPVGAVALQWFTKSKYLTDFPLIYVYGTLVVERQAFERLTAADQAVAREVFTAVTRELDTRTRADNESAREALRKEGIQFVEPAPEARARWEAVAAEATEKLGADGAYTQEAYEAVRRAVAAVRTPSGGG